MNLDLIMLHHPLILITITQLQSNLYNSNKTAAIQAARNAGHLRSRSS